MEKSELAIHEAGGGGAIHKGTGNGSCIDDSVIELSLWVLGKQ